MVKNDTYGIAEKKYIYIFKKKSYKDKGNILYSLFITDILLIYNIEVFLFLV